VISLLQTKLRLEQTKRRKESQWVEKRKVGRGNAWGEGLSTAKKGERVSGFLKEKKRENEIKEIQGGGGGGGKRNSFRLRGTCSKDWEEKVWGIHGDMG